MSNAKFLEAASAAERAAAAVGTEAELAETMKVLRYMEEIEIALVNQAALAVSQTPRQTMERLPLRESGDDIGRIEARIPKNLAFRFMKQRNFGEDGFYSDEGMRDFLKAYPQYAVRTVSGKTVVGYRGRSKVVFGPGVLDLAT
jgi:metal-dependent amidase/aminoacylase/carboxypeptidase family protein